MGCPTSITDSGDVLEIGFWVCFTLCVHLVGTYFCWNKRWYAYLHGKTLAPAEKVYNTATMALALANAYGAWRVWFCNDWDTKTGLAVLSVYFFMILAQALFVPSVMLTKSPAFAIVVGIVASGLSIAFTVLAYIQAHDNWVGLIGVADIIMSLAFLIFAIELQVRSLDIYGKYEAEKGDIVRKYPKSGKSSGYEKIDQDPASPGSVVTGNGTGTTPDAGFSIGSHMHGHVTHRGHAARKPSYDVPIPMKVESS